MLIPWPELRLLSQKLWVGAGGPNMSILLSAHIILLYDRSWESLNVKRGFTLPRVIPEMFPPIKIRTRLCLFPYMWKRFKLLR